MSSYNPRDKPQLACLCIDKVANMASLRDYAVSFYAGISEGDDPIPASALMTHMQANRRKSVKETTKANKDLIDTWDAAMQGRSGKLTEEDVAAILFPPQEEKAKESAKQEVKKETTEEKQYIRGLVPLTLTY